MLPLLTFCGVVAAAAGGWAIYSYASVSRERDKHIARREEGRRRLFAWTNVMGRSRQLRITHRPDQDSD